MYSIKKASLLTGIGAHTLRAWEKRYSLVKPARSENGRRLYCDQDIEKLKLVSTLSRAGQQISQVAKLGDGELVDRVSKLSQKELYPDEEQKIENSLYILKQAYDCSVEEVITHEIESVKGELYRGVMSCSSYVKKLIVPFYKYVQDKSKFESAGQLGQRVVSLLEGTVNQMAIHRCSSSVSPTLVNQMRQGNFSTL